MQRQPVRTAADRSNTEGGDSDRQLQMDVDAVHVRNYDHADGHSVHVTVVDPDGRVHLTERCYLSPGQSRRLTGGLDPGEYRIDVRVDGVDRATAECRIDGSPAWTAVVELGNGVVSVTEGAEDFITV